MSGPPPVPPEKPRASEAVNVKFESKDLALAVVLAAMYAALVIVQGLSAAATIQLRIADCLIPLAALFGWPAVIGVSAGAFVGNISISMGFSNGVYDVAFGPLANFLAGTVIFTLRRRHFAGCVLGSTVIGLIVGSYVWMIFGAPSDVFSLKIPGTWPVWLASIASITASSLVAIAVIGYALLSILSRENILGPLKSKGAKTVSDTRK